MIFSGPMVRAILDGRKSMTRRVLNVPETHGHFVGIYAPGLSAVFAHNTTDMIDDVSIKLHGKGDLLWVRETWGMGLSDHGDCPRYKATMDYKCGDKIKSDGEGPFVWKSPIHMPRWASRITLEVTDVRVQRLQDISKSDVIAEGITGLDDVHAGWHEPFAALWNSIHGPDAWNSNPFVAAYSFRRVMG